MFISPINNSTRVSFGHIYSTAVDSVIKRSDSFTKKQEAKLDKLVTRASELNKSVITSSTSKGIVLLTSTDAGTRNIHNTYPLCSDSKTNLEQLEDAVKDAEALEKTNLPDINPFKDCANPDSLRGISEHGINLYHIYAKTLNGYNVRF